MKRIVSLLLVSFSCFALAESSQEPEVQRISFTEIAQHAQYWATRIPEISPEEYSLLANLLYFDCLTKFYEGVSRNMLIALYVQLINMNRQLIKSETNSKRIGLDTASKLQQLYNELLPLRSYCAKSMEACAQEIEKSEFGMLKDIISNLQKYSKAMILQCIKQDQESITRLIENEKMALEEQINQLQGCQKICQDVLNNYNSDLPAPFHSALANIDTAVLNSDAIIAHVNAIALPSFEVKNISAEILNVHVIIMRTFCNALIELLAQKNFPPIQIMFDQNGLIEKEKRDENIRKLDNQFSIDKKHYAAQ